MVQPALKCIFTACADVAGEHDMASLKEHLAKDHLDYAPHVCANCDVASYDRVAMMEHGEADGHPIIFGKARDATCERLMEKYFREAIETAAPSAPPPMQTGPVLRARSKRRLPDESSPAASAIPDGLRRVPDVDLPAQKTLSGYHAFAKANTALTRAEIHRRGLPLSAWGTIPGKWWQELTDEERQAWSSKAQPGTKATPPPEKKHREELEQESDTADKTPLPIEIPDHQEMQTGVMEGTISTPQDWTAQRDGAVEEGMDDRRDEKGLSFFCCPHDSSTFD